MKNVATTFSAAPGLVAQCFGALALVAGFGVIFGLGAALLCLGVVLLVGGTLMEMPSPGSEVIEEVGEVDDGSWIGEAA
jgi:hypothetical protein